MCARGNDRRERVAGADRSAFLHVQLLAPCPATGAVISFSIFMASITHTTAPASTSWPFSRSRAGRFPAAVTPARRCPRRCAAPRSRRGAGRAPAELLGGDHAARGRRADHLHVEPAAVDLDRVVALDLLLVLVLLPPARRRARGRAISATWGPRPGRGRSRRCATASDDSSALWNGISVVRPPISYSPSARSMRAVAASRSASHTISFATIGSYIGEISEPGRTPESTRTPGPPGSRRW